MRTDHTTRRALAAAEAIGRRMRHLAHQLDTMTTRVRDLSRVTLHTGQAPVGALLLGAQRDIPVNLTPTPPDDTYSAVATLAGGSSILGALTIVGITAQTDTTATVTVRATGVVSTGATVTVIAAATRTTT